jgi:stage II sporulation protein D
VRISSLAAALLLCASARGEEIRIEVARGALTARLEAELRPGGRKTYTLAARGGELLLNGAVVASPLRAPGPLRLDGRELPGSVEVSAREGRLVTVNTLDLEDYVAAVVASEIPAGWPSEALRAQAVAARTFAVAQKIAQGPGARAHLGASVLDQVYKGAAHPDSGALKAARATAGEVLTWGAAPIAAYFSASCGGVSESAEAAFALERGLAPYLRGGFEDDADAREWTVRIGVAEISAALRKADRFRAGVNGVAVASRTASGRARTMRLQTSAGPRPLLAVELRQIVGYGRLPSLLFDVAMDGSTAVFHGRGSGHGVGLCQWGARGRARRGESYREILAHYYPGAELRRMY